MINSRLSNSEYEKIKDYSIQGWWSQHQTNMHGLDNVCASAYFNVCTQWESARWKHLSVGLLTS